MDLACSVGADAGIAVGAASPTTGEHKSGRNHLRNGVELAVNDTTQQVRGLDTRAERPIAGHSEADPLAVTAG
jgi:hypothetical protein